MDENKSSCEQSDVEEEEMETLNIKIEPLTNGQKVDEQQNENPGCDSISVKLEVNILDNEQNQKEKQDSVVSNC